MIIDVDLHEVHLLAAELGAAGPKAQRESAGALSKAAQETQAAAQAAVPVRTGGLRNSIGVRGHGDEQIVEATSPYAVYVEFGTSRMGPQPFMWPAATTAEKSLATEFEQLGDPFD